MTMLSKRLFVVPKRPSKVQNAVVNYVISDNGVASVDAAQVLQIPNVQTQLAAVQQLRLADIASHKRK